MSCPSSPHLRRALLNRDRRFFDLILAHGRTHLKACSDRGNDHQGGQGSSAASGSPPPGLSGPGKPNP